MSKKGHVRVIGPTRMEAMLLLMRAYGIARTPLVLKKGWQNPPSLYDDASSSLHDCGAIDAHVERDGNGVVYLVDDMAGRRG